MIKFELVSAVGILTDVKWLKTMTVLAMLALWLPATNHCRLEQIPGLGFLVCCDHEATAPHQDNDCDTDGCALFENGHYRTEEPQAALPAPDLVVLAMLFSLAQEAPCFHVAQARVRAPAPPELPRAWQFSFRAALPVRAPSIAV